MVLFVVVIIVIVVIVIVLFVLFLFLFVVAGSVVFVVVYYLFYYYYYCDGEYHTTETAPMSEESYYPHSITFFSQVSFSTVLSIPCISFLQSDNFSSAG